MPSRTDILDQPERLRGPFVSSVALHVSVVALIVVGTWAESRRPRVSWGDINGGGMGSVAVNVVPRIPLPSQSGPLNPVANDTQSLAPEPPAPSKAKPQQVKTKVPDPLAVEIPTRNAPRKPGEASSRPNTFRQQQQDLPNQVYSQSGQRMVDPSIGLPGGGGDIRVGTDSPFGTQYGWYTRELRNRVSRFWNSPIVDRRAAANEIVVVFTIMKNGSVPQNSVRVVQTCRIPALDDSAVRAILQAQPFGPLPTQYSGNSIEIEFTFVLRR